MNSNPVTMNAAVWMMVINDCRASTFSACSGGTPTPFITSCISRISRNVEMMLMVMIRPIASSAAVAMSALPLRL